MARRAPIRSCVACRTARPKRELVRIVRAPDGRVTIDETGREAGRGAYLCRDAACWTKGLERGAIGRALATPIPPELREELQARVLTLTTDEGGIGGEE